MQGHDGRVGHRRLTRPSRASARVRAIAAGAGGAPGASWAVPAHAGPLRTLDHRPRSVSELIDVGIALVRRHFVRYCMVAAICLVPAQAIEGGMTYVLHVDLVNSAKPDFAALGAIMAVSIAFLALVESALAAAVAQSWEGRDDVDVPAALRAGLRRWVPALTAILLKYLLLFALAMIGFIVGLIVLFGAMFAMGRRDTSDTLMYVVVALVMVVGGLAALPAIGRLAVVPATAILEPRGPIGALSRSNQLTKGLWKHSVGVSALAFLIAIVPYLGAALLAGEFGSRIVQQIVGTVMSVILTPIYVASLVALYYDLRIRKEGFDLELMASELATAVPDAGPDLPIVRGA